MHGGAVTEGSGGGGSGAGGSGGWSRATIGAAAAATMGSHMNYTLSISMPSLEIGASLEIGGEDLPSLGAVDALNNAPQ